jgi:hypothetical protein
MERRLGIMQSVEPVLENAIKTLQKVVDVRGMGKSLIQLNQEEVKFELPKTKDEIAAMSREEEDEYNGKKLDLMPKDWDKPEKISPEEAQAKEEAEEAGREGQKAIADGEKAADAAENEANNNAKVEETKGESKMSKEVEKTEEGEEEKKDAAVEEEIKATEEKVAEEKKADAGLVQLRRLDVTAYGFE